MSIFLRSMITVFIFQCSACSGKPDRLSELGNSIGNIVESSTSSTVSMLQNVCKLSGLLSIVSLFTSFTIASVATRRICDLKCSGFKPLHFAYQVNADFKCILFQGSPLLQHPRSYSNHGVSKSDSASQGVPIMQNNALTPHYHKKNDGPKIW